MPYDRDAPRAWSEGRTHHVRRPSSMGASASTAEALTCRKLNESSRTVMQRQQIEALFGSAAKLPAAAHHLASNSNAPPRQRVIMRGNQQMTLDQVEATVNRDPSAIIKSEEVRFKLRNMIAEQTSYTLEEIMEALGAGAKRITRGEEGDITWYQPLSSDTLNLSSIAGTHRSVATKFEDGRTVEAMAQSLTMDPSLVARTEAFVLTVFRSSAPGEPQGDPLIWSMNNRRLKAMQWADAELRKRNAQLPPIRVQWATKADVAHAVRPGAFNNKAHGSVGFHSTTDRIQRLDILTSNRSNSSQPSVRSIHNALGNSEDLAKLLDL